jgi:hypothetical protein
LWISKKSNVPSLIHIFFKNMVCCVIHLNKVLPTAFSWEYTTHSNMWLRERLFYFVDCVCCSDIDLVTVISVSCNVIYSKTQDHLSNVC